MPGWLGVFEGHACLLHRPEETDWKPLSGASIKAQAVPPAETGHQEGLEGDKGVEGRGSSWARSACGGPSRGTGVTAPLLRSLSCASGASPRAAGLTRSLPPSQDISQTPLFPSPLHTTRGPSSPVLEARLAWRPPCHHSQQSARCPFLPTTSQSGPLPGCLSHSVATTH